MLTLSQEDSRWRPNISLSGGHWVKTENIPISGAQYVEAEDLLISGGTSGGGQILPCPRRAAGGSRNITLS
jgi:hypothetical protein